MRLRLGLQSATRPIQVPSWPHTHPHRLLRPPQRTKAPQDAKSAPRGRHGAMADAIHAGAVASPWREPEKRHCDMATIWRRYSDALTTMLGTRTPPWARSPLRRRALRASRPRLQPRLRFLRWYTWPTITSTFLDSRSIMSHRNLSLQSSCLTVHTESIRSMPSL